MPRLLTRGGREVCEAAPAPQFHSVAVEVAPRTGGGGLGELGAALADGRAPWGEPLPIAVHAEPLVGVRITGIGVARKRESVEGARDLNQALLITGAQQAVVKVRVVGWLRPISVKTLWRISASANRYSVSALPPILMPISPSAKRLFSMTMSCASARPLELSLIPMLEARRMRLSRMTSLRLPDR